MLSRLLVKLLFLFVVIFISGSLLAEETPAGDLSSPRKSIADSYNSFGFDLYSAELESHSGENVVISPASVAFALAMTYNGTAGSTCEGMSTTLHLPEMTLEEINNANRKLLIALGEASSSTELVISNSIWLKKHFSFDSGFISRNEKYFNAGVFPLESAQLINDWVKINTMGKIDQIIDSISSDDLIYLVNAIFFKGSWTKRFDPARTSTKNFHLSCNKSVKIPMMIQNGKYGYLEEEGLQAIRLPYGKGESSIYIFLPSEDSDLRAFHETLTEASLDKWIGAFESRKGSIEIPRFKTEYRSELRKSLSSLGMETAFSNLADFSRLCNAKPGEVRIDKVIHKTFIEINEEGTEAAAATSVGIVLTSTAFGPKPFHMIVDRPFFFVLRDDDSGMILFMGSVTNPS